jgi:hypothetical protein
MEDEEGANKNYSDTESYEPADDSFEAKESNNKKTKPATHAFRRVRDYYNTDMNQYQALSIVYFQTTIKKLKKGQIINKNPPSVFDALLCDETQKKWRTPPLNPSIGKRWRCLVDKDNQTLLKKMVAVNAGNPAATRLTSNATR